MLVSPNVTFAETTRLLTETTRLLSDSPEKTSGWSGYVQYLAGGSIEKGLANWSDDNKHINSLDSKPSSYNEPFFVPLWQLGYTIPGEGTMLFFGTPDIRTVETPVAIEAGISQEFADGSFFSASYSPKVSELSADVWQDPYLTGEKRKRAESSVEVLRFAAEYILGSPLSIRYSYSEQSIKDDHAGQSLKFRLTPGQLKQLQRDTRLHNASFLLTFPMSAYFYIIPKVHYAHAKAEGDVNSYTTTGFELTVFYQTRKFDFFANAYLNTNKYHKVNPIFNTKRNENNYGVSVGISYLTLFDWQNTSFELMLSNTRNDSDIHFYDKRETVLMSGLTYSF